MKPNRKPRLCLEKLVMEEVKDREVKKERIETRGERGAGIQKDRREREEGRKEGKVGEEMAPVECLQIITLTGIG